jgi:hypothetical protein
VTGDALLRLLKFEGCNTASVSSPFNKITSCSESGVRSVACSTRQVSRFDRSSEHCTFTYVLASRTVVALPVHTVTLPQDLTS